MEELKLKLLDELESSRRVYENKSKSYRDNGDKKELDIAVTIWSDMITYLDLSYRLGIINRDDYDSMYDKYIH